MTIIDQNTGEVTIFDHDVALQTDTELIALSEAALEFTLARLEDMRLDDVSELRGNLQGLNRVLSARMRERDARLEAANNLSEARLRLERDTGESIPRLQANGMLMGRESGRPKVSNDTTLSAPLSDYQITRDQSSLWQKIAAIPVDDFEDYLATSKENGWEISSYGALKFKVLVDHQLLNASDNNEWYTPPQYIASVHAVLGGVDVDPASNISANRIIQAETIYTEENSGFDKAWNGRVFLNPPYGVDSGNESNQHRWSARLIEQYTAGITTAAILLVNAVPGNKWFAPLWQFPICFVDHRIRFYNDDTEAGQPTHGNAFIYMGDNALLFASEFERHGPIAIAYGGEAWQHLTKV